VLLTGVVVLIARYRRFGPAERRQIGWPLYGLALTGCAILVLGAAHSAVNGLPGWLRYALYLPVLLLIPAGLVIGILRYRLLDIHLVVRRSVVYGALWLLIAVAYAGVTAALGLVAGRRVPLDLAIVLTIIVTMVAAPLRRRLERLADRLVFGRRLSGYQLISQLGTRLEASPGPEDVASTVADAVRLGLDARWVRVSLGRRSERPVASAGIDLMAPDDPVLHVPLVHGPDVVGAIDCGPKREGRYLDRDQELLATLGRQAALAIRNSQLTTELSQRFGELAESRARMVHAEAAGRRQLERDIHDGVQQELVAVLARLGLARNQLRRDKELAETTLKDVLADGRRALESLQELVRGIHPPVLTDRGLLDAVRERAARLPIAAEVSSDGLPPEARFGPDIEGAAYFFVCEALGNILKHADATRAMVCLQADAGQLSVEVRDDGRGFAVQAADQSGLRGLRDRIEALGGRMGYPQTGVVILSQYSDASYAVQLFRNGTDGLGYLLKASIGELDDLLHALREVTAGRSVVDARVVELLVEQRIRQAESPLGRLGPRELEVLKEMAEGKTNAAIGETLHLSESAIEKYVNAIFAKLGLSAEPKISRRVVAVLAYLRDLDRRT
jgi:signal transduction histidine kinase/DNA-binding CsgD family transcriptional regulator